MPFETEDQMKPAILALLNDVAGSEHFLRHKQAFDEVVAKFGFELRTEGGFRCVDPVAEAAEKEAAEKALQERFKLEAEANTAEEAAAIERKAEEDAKSAAEVQAATAKK